MLICVKFKGNHQKHENTTYSFQTSGRKETIIQHEAGERENDKEKGWKPKSPKMVGKVPIHLTIVSRFNSPLPPPKPPDN